MKLDPFAGELNVFNLYLSLPVVIIGLEIYTDGNRVGMLLRLDFNRVVKGIEPPSIVTMNHPVRRGEYSENEKQARPE